MKKLLFLSLGLLSVMLDSSASAATARVATKAPATANVAGRTTAVRGATSAPASNTPTVVARAATTQKVVGGGTKVAAAAKNIVVSEECQAKYDGCMDSFCMIDNDSGGRCVCSDKNAELDLILSEIEKLDEQSYQMATLGVEKLEMGADADAAIAEANRVAESLKKGELVDTKKSARKAIDLSMWDVDAEFEEEEDVFSESVESDSFDGKSGDSLHKAAAALCKAQIPECEKDINMLQLMYTQRIKSDCTAYENVLKQKKTQSSQKLQTAERALRETALEQYQNANKYDLGQCTVKFKECMQTTGGCGDDFSKCASVAAFDATNTRQSSSKKSSNYFVQGAISTIEISASTYDALVSKKPLCESVTKQCTKVASQVWDTFLKEVAPQLKSAEIIAEDNARQDCIGNISSCFQKACKDTMDPNDPDGSYDMCLSRPEAMLNVCKVPLNNCSIDASSITAAKKSIIWDFVTARLAAMRVDACTTEVKECLKSEDVCGKDYLQCIGLDTYTIVNMCHRDKLTACYSKEYGSDDKEREDYIYSVAQGIILNIDNEMIAQCQKAANEAMIKVCGDTQSCENMTIPDGVGAHALEYKVCEVMGNEDAETLTYYNCKQDVSLIPDSDLLGEATEGSAIAAAKKQYEEEVAQLEAGGGLFVKLRKAIAEAKLNKIAMQERINNTYTGPKNYTGMIDGVITWHKIATSIGLPSQCQEDGFGMGEEEQKTASNKNASKRANKNVSEVKQLCISGMSAAVESPNIGQNNVVKAEQALSDIGSLRNSIQNTIFAIESDPTVQFCMTGRRVQGLKMGQDGKQEKTEGRFPNLIDQMKVTIAQSALHKAQDNYNKKYKELEEKVQKDNVKLAERIVEVRKAQEAKDRIPVLASACLGTAVALNSAKLEAGADLSRTSSSKDGDSPYYRETVITTFSPTTMICKKCTRTQNCTKQKGYKNAVDDTRYCRTWSDPQEKCTETQY